MQRMQKFPGMQRRQKLQKNGNNTMIGRNAKMQKSKD